MKQRPLSPIPLFKPEPQTRVPLSDLIGFGLEYLFLSCVVLLFFQAMTPSWADLINDVSINFLAIILEALPFMLIGSLAGGIIEVFVPITWMDRIFGQRRLLAVFLAGGMGILFPVCECAIVPVVRRLLGKGIPFGAAITFLLAGPIVNVIVASSTAIAYRFNWVFVATRLGLGYMIAVVIGLIMGKLFNHHTGLAPNRAIQNACSCGHDHGIDNPSLFIRLHHSLEHASDDFFNVGRYLIIGSFIAALMRSTVGMSTFLGLAESPWITILLMMVMAVLLNLCSEADAFIAASFRGLLPGSAQMAFMVLGPMLDIKLILMYFSVFRKRTIITLIVLIPSIIFATMISLHFLLPGLLAP